MMRAAIGLLAMMACARESSAQLSPESQDGAVYSTALDSLFTVRGIRHSARVMVGDSTSSSTIKVYTMLWRRTTSAGLVAELFRDFGFVDSSTVRAFEDRNQVRVVIPSLSVSRGEVIRVSAEPFEKNPKEFQPRVRTLMGTYPAAAGVIYFSPIGYNSRGDVAIVMVDQHCGQLCGQGYLVGLQRVKGKWRVAMIKPTWMS